MKTALYLYKDEIMNRIGDRAPDIADNAQLVLAFGARELLKTPSLHGQLRSRFPVADIVVCSTAGEICNTEVYDGTVSIAAIKFDTTIVRPHAIILQDDESSFDAGIRLLREFDREGLSYILVLADGSHVNGSELVRGINEQTRGKILVTGGLAGDGNHFTSTLTGLNEAVHERIIVGIGFYGDKLKIAHGSRGGWTTFGLEKTVTRAVNNVLYEIDGKNALDIYKKYLGPDAEELPGSALLFPLSIVIPGTDEQVVRTILSIDPQQGSMTFAGDIPEGATVRFMKANFDKITGAASDATLQTLQEDKRLPDLALLISCVGRKLMLQFRIDEELEAVNEVFKGEVPLVGFYSYGEISPIAGGDRCQLHNQTMTITTFYETE